MLKHWCLAALVSISCPNAAIFLYVLFRRCLYGAILSLSTLIPLFCSTIVLPYSPHRFSLVESPISVQRKAEGRCWAWG